MSQVNYDFQLFNTQGQYIRSLEGIIEATFGRSKNEVGLCEITVPAELYNDTDFIIDNQLLILRQNELTGQFDNIGQTKWFLRTIIYTIDEQCVENVELTFTDTIGLLLRRPIPYLQLDQSNSPSQVALEEADDAMKSVLYWNIGSNVDGSIPATVPDPGTYVAQGPIGAVATVYGSAALRDQHRPFPIVISAYESLGVPINSTYEFITTLDALVNFADLAKAQNQNIWFDILYDQSTDVYRFVTWVNRRGQDLSESVFVGPDFSNLTNATYTIDAINSCDIVYVSGSGQGALKLVGAATEGLNEDKPFRPIECMVNDTQLDLQASVDSQALIEVANRRTEPIIEGEVLNILGTRMFVDINYGDILTADWRGVQYPIEIYEFSVSLTNEGEEIEIPFRELIEPFN